jgi:hypothetical protein
MGDMARETSDSKNRYVYLLQSRAHPAWFKIGFSSVPDERAAELNRDISKLDWVVLDLMWCPDEKTARDLEKTLHLVFDHRRVVGKHREWFVLEAADVHLIRTLFQTARDRDVMRWALTPLDNSSL